MKREYFGMLIAAIILILLQVFDEVLIEEFQRKYWVMLIFSAYFLGQYSTKFPKRF